jgi:tRNA (guanine-N7-)-methyltransferase
VRRASRLPLEALQPYLLNVPAPVPPRQTQKTSALAPSTPEPLDWRHVFGNDQAVEIEVGCGKGMFLVNAGQARAEVNFLGIEIERKYALYAATRLAKRRLTNVKVACTDARAFLRDLVADNSFQAIHVYFPDPWWKTRHRKRRVFTDDFVRDCARVLRSGGHLYVVSDVEDYFQEIVGTIARETHLRALPAPELKEPQHDLDYLTNFERKYRKENRPIHRAVFEK